MQPIGLVLAGGSSQRMGSDKTRLRTGEARPSLPERAALLLRPVCSEVAVADRGRRLLPHLPSLPDGAGEGPAAGILGGAGAYPGRSLLVLACDLPAVPLTLLAELARPSGFDWVVPRWNGRLEPLAALYRPAALAALAAAVERGVLAPHRLEGTAGLSVRFLGEPVLSRFGRPEEMFRNLNTPADWARWEEESSG